MKLKELIKKLDMAKRLVINVEKYDDKFIDIFLEEEIKRINI